jgi:dTDP-4-dehydrorhamnose reductase
LTSTPAQRTRLLVTGGTGLLGVNWAAAMRGENDIWLATHKRGLRLRGVQAVALSLESAPALARVLDDIRPDVIVHAAGLSNVDDCERAPGRARDINAGLAATVAGEAAQRGLKLVHISTDHLFAGDRPMCREEDAPAPVNAYARSKLEGERLVAQRCPQALIVRTNFFGWGHAFRKSISDWVIDGLRSGQRLRTFGDVHFTPILAACLARTAHALLAKGASGVVHVCGDERVSKHEFALRLAAAFGLAAGGIEESRYADAGLAAPRPRDMSLSNARARGILGAKLGGLDDYFSELRRQEESGLRGELQQAITE